MDSLVTPQICRQALESARDFKSPLMGFRARAYKEITGRYYQGDNATGPSQAMDLRRMDHPDRPVAVMRHSALTIRAVLSHKTPRFDFGSEIPDLNGQAAIYEMKFNKEAVENNFRALGKKAILDALVSPITVVRTGIRFGDEMFAASGRERDLNQWFARLVDGDNYTWDPDCTDWEDRAWDAEEYLVSRADLLAAGIYEPELVEAIDEDAPDGGSDFVRNLSGKALYTESPFVEWLRLVDMFFYDLQGNGDTYKVTFARHGDSLEFLHFGPWQGPTRGPFTRLEFEPVPHNVASLSSAVAQYEQSRTTDELWSRVNQQAKKSTKKPVVPDGAPQDDVDAIKKDDAEMIRSDAAGQATVLDLDLVSVPLISVATQNHQFANTAAKNPDVLSGQSSDTKTATEFSGLMGMVQVNMKDMQETVETFWTAIARSWLWYQLYHPATQLPSATIQGQLQFPSGERYSVVLSPEQKEGEFLDYTITVRPGSSMFMDETIRSQREDAMIAKAMPLMQLEAMTGGFFRGSKFWQDRMMQLGADSMGLYFGNPAAMAERLQQFAALGIQSPSAGQIVPSGGSQKKPTDAVRSANAGMVPA